ncbi:MAG: response regulator [Desulfuromonadales bacterium]|nr:response regulator [Desulfuromonadales bacterium]
MFSKKIVVSDVFDLLTILKGSFFQREGFDLVRVIDGEEAFRAIEAESPAMAILDLSSLGEQGIECCKRVKSDPLLLITPVILLLPEDRNDLTESCWQAGCDAVLERPLSALRLLDDTCGLLGISRRLARRFPVSFKLEFSLQSTKKYLGTAVNLNAGGMFLSTEHIYPIDTKLSLEFTLPGYRIPLQCAARVAWVNHPEWIKKNNLPCGMGVQFLELGGTSGAALCDFLGNLLKEG